MTSPPKVSVILPVFNAAKSIGLAIDSILNQKYQDFELIIVNDGSNDLTEEVVHKFNNSLIRYFKLSHGGIAKALNFGIKMSRGELLARMDADDYSYTERLKDQVAYLDQHQHIGLVSCLVEYDGNREQNTGYALYVDWINDITTDIEVFRKRFQESPIAHPTVMFRKELIAKLGGYNEESLPEDYELWLRWMASGIQMAKLPKILYRWTDHHTRLSRTHSNYEEGKFYSLKAKYLSAYLESKYSKDNIPKIWIWGTGKSVRKRIAPLLNYSVCVEKHIEVKPPPYQNPSIIYYKHLPKPEGQIVLSYVSDRKGKKEIQYFLEQNGYQEGVSYFMMA